MTTPTVTAEQKVILRGVSWATYERLLAEHQDASGTHFIYDDGDLEIMVLSARREQPNRTLEILVDVLAEEFDLDIQQVGSMTFKREHLRKGFEPDSAFYIAHSREIRVDELEPATAPPPDLVIEIDISRPSLNRFPVYAAFGVREIWRYHQERVAIYELRSGGYYEVGASLAFPALTAGLATQFLAERRQTRYAEWVRRVRAWARSHAEAGN